MWVQFVIGSRPCSEGFSPGSTVFVPPQKPTFLNSNSIRNLRAMGLSVEDCCMSPSLNKVDLFTLFNIMCGLLTKLVRSRWLDIDLVLFLRVYGPRLHLGP